MQLIPRYLVKNKITIVSTDTGFPTEYRIVFSRQLKIYKNIDNTIQFRLLNADQKPVDISPYTPYIVVFDENRKEIIKKEGQSNQGSSITNNGKFTITITENDLKNVNRQYLRYNIYLLDSNGNKQLTYTNSDFDNHASIFVDDYAFPGPNEPYIAETFIEQIGNNVWLSETIDAQPGINGNEALHTIAIYNNNYIGNVVVQATLSTQIDGNEDWADISTISLSGSETEPIPYNFNGVFNYLRFSFDNDPTSKISKVLIRN